MRTSPDPASFQTLDALAKGQVTSRQLTELTLDRIEACSPLRSFISVTDRQNALAAAQASDDRRRSSGQSVRALEGIPLALKDNFTTAGVRTTAASAMLQSNLCHR